MSDSMKEYRITVRLPGELRERIREAAHRNGARASDIVRGAVERFFAAETDEITAYERARRAGLIGAVPNADRDLSTNPKYFDGFGVS